MTDEKSSTNAEVYRAKKKLRQMKASEPFTKKLHAVVRMQQMECEIAKSMGRAYRKPWSIKLEE